MRVVLVGGGHAHLYTLLRTAELVDRGGEVTLVSDSPYLHYSGMATGVISGLYEPRRYRIDVRGLVERGGGVFVQDRVVRIDAAEKEIVLNGGETVSYDVASVCLGSETPGRGMDALCIKPVENVVEIRNRLLSLVRSRIPRVLVVGGGAAGCEVAANVLALFERVGVRGDVTLTERSEGLLQGAPRRAREHAGAHLRARGAKVLTNTHVVSLTDGVARTREGRELLYDLAVLATGVVPPDVFRTSGLSTGKDGGLLVDEKLRSVDDACLFGGGDCISYRGESLPRFGVFAVRQGPVIYRNLRATLEGGPLVGYRPQRLFLYILNFGDGTGLAVYGPLVWRGRFPWRVKDCIDRGFLERYRLDDADV